MNNRKPLITYVFDMEERFLSSHLEQFFILLLVNLYSRLAKELLEALRFKCIARVIG